MTTTANLKLALDQLATQVKALMGASGGGAIFPIWAEENGGLASNGYEWSWGNGATGTDIGIPMGIDCELFAVSFNADIFGTSVSMRTQVNGSIIRTSSFASNNSVDDGFTPIAIAKGSRLDFRTGTVVGTTTDARVCAWFRET